MSTKKFVTKGDVTYYFKMYSEAVMERTGLPLWHFEPADEDRYRNSDPSYMFCVVVEMHFLSVPVNQVTDQFPHLREFIKECDEEMHSEIVDTLPSTQLMDIPLEVAEMVNALVTVWNRQYEKEVLVA